jgi:thioredoxin reductase (NADPH)
VQDLIIVGSGPAGYTAAIYAARADLHPVVIEGFAWGGLLQQTTEVANFPGFQEGILGPQLMQQMRDQAERFGATLISEDVDELHLNPDGHRLRVGKKWFEARAVILALGAQPRTLGISGEQRLAGRGVSYCATCDAAFFRDRTVVVAGGGDSAMEEAAFLTRFADQVSIVHRQEKFRASAVMQHQAFSHDNLDALTPYVISEINGDTSVEAVTVRQAITGEERLLAADGVFIAIGHQPNSALVVAQLQCDADGYIRTRPGMTHTSMPGVFAAGDVVDHRYRQAITAAGSGCQAALDAGEWLGQGSARPWPGI